MFVSYDGLIFDLLLLEDWVRDARYSEDRTTFLFWEHTLTVVCMLNVDATSAARFPPLPFAAAPRRQGPVGAPGRVKNVAPARPYDTGRPRTDLDAYFSRDDQDEIKKILTPPPHPAAQPRAVGPASQRLLPGFGQAVGAATDARRRFRPDRDPPTGAGRRNPAAARALPALNSTYPTVPATDVELRARLRRPRRQLLVWLHSGPGGAAEYMLVSPLHPDAHSDAQHGPVCTVMDCPQVVGNVSAVMRLQFTTWEATPLEWTTADTFSARLRPDPLDDAFLRKAARPDTPEGRLLSKAAREFNAALNKGVPVLGAATALAESLRKAGVAQAAAGALADAARAAANGAAVAADGIVAAAQAAKGNRARQRLLATPALLSHRWKMAFGWNPETHLRTQTVEGEALFRADVLALRHLTADQLRGYIWHPIPEGYQRHPVGDDDLLLSEDGLGIRYRVHDEQRLMNLPGGVRWGVTHMDVEQTMTVNTGNTIYGPTEAPR